MTKNFPLTRQWPTVQDARLRTEVELRDGRRAFLLYVPAPSARRSAGQKARVGLECGSIISVDMDDIVTPERPEGAA